MSWEWQKNILIATGILLIVILAFLLGAAYGVSSDRKQFVDTLIPVFSTAGSWVSGIGALGAVFVSLWLAEKQARKDREQLKLSISSVLTTIHPEARLCIEVVSTGQKPSNISSISLTGKNSSRIMALVNFANGSSALPTKLGYGEKAYYFLQQGGEKEIGEYLKNNCAGSAKELQIYINTTTEVFILKPEKEMKSMLESHAK